jgi:hypothetical protein
MRTLTEERPAFCWLEYTEFFSTIGDIAEKIQGNFTACTRDDVTAHIWRHEMAI